MSRALFLIDLLQRLATDCPLTIVETGTVRNEQWHIGDGHSTRYIASFVRDRGQRDRFYSIDLNPHAVAVSRELLRVQGLLDCVVLVQDHSARALAALDGPIDFAYLDSADDPENTYAEFLTILPKLASTAVIAIDDSSLDLYWSGVNKGKLVVAWAREHGRGLRAYQQIVAFGLGIDL